MSDYTKLVKALRRCASIDRCDGMCEMNYGSTGCESSLEMDAAAAIEELLPKRGKWELIDGAEPMRWGCSRCKYLSWETSNYCPRCGAKMMEVRE